MSLRSTNNALLGLLLLFFFGLSLPGHAQDPSIIFMNPNPTQSTPNVTTYCASGTLRVGFTDFIDPSLPNPAIYNTGNRYVLQLSDANGSFASPIIITTSSFTSSANRVLRSAELSGPIPATVVAGSGYLVRIATTSPVTYGAVFGSTITILAAATQPDFGPSVTVLQNGSLTLTNTAACSGTVAWGRTNGDMATGTGNIPVPTTQTGVASYTATCRTTACGNGPVRAVSVTVVAPPPPTNLNLTGGTLTCTQTSVTLTGSATNGTSYSLSNGQSNTTGLFTVNAPGTYTLTVANATGQTAFTTATVLSNTALPGLTLSPQSGTLTCTNPTVTPMASATAANTTFAWTGNSVGASLSVAAVGAYSVTATAPNGCTQTATATVGSNTTAPTLSIAGSGTLTCTAPSLTLTATSSATALRWTGNTMGNLLTVNAGGTYSVTATGENGCVSITSVVVSQSNTAPTLGLAISGSSTLTCSLTAITFTASVINSVNTAYSFSGPGIVASVANSATVNVGGVYSVTATNLATGCFSVTTTTVSSNTTAPTAGLAPSSTTLTCTRTTITLAASGGSGLPGGTYSFGGTGIVASAGSSATVNQPGTFSVLVTAPNGCTATQTATITSNTIVVTATLTANPNATLTCAQTALTLTAGTGLLGNTYSFGGPTPVSQSGNVLVVNTAGTYSVTVTNAASGCFSSTTLQVSQTNAGLVSVSLTTPITNLTLTTPSALLTATPGAGTYRFVGPGLNQTGANNTATGSQAGVYSVTAGLGICATTASITLTGTGGPGPAPTPFAVVTGVLSCATPTATIEVIGGYQFDFMGLNGTPDGLVSVFDGWYRENVGDGYRLVRIPIPTSGRAVVNKPGTYTVIARGENGTATTTQVVVTGVACL
jgi:trimeric autotransporter adhesin